MFGPTGVGKTAIARRLAKLVNAPIVKVEAPKFPEVGFHGRDVDQIIRDLVDNAIVMVRARMRREAAAAIASAVEERLLGAVLGEHAAEDTRASFRALLRCARAGAGAGRRRGEGWHGGCRVCGVAA